MIGSLMFVSGCAKKKIARKGNKGVTNQASFNQDSFSTEDLDSIQLDALSGEDIPLSDIPLDLAQQEFVKPDPTIFENIYFDYDSTILKDNYLPILSNIGTWLQDNSNTHVMIEGHADERGTNEYNLALGEQRALSVRRYLTSLGVDPDRLHTISYGEERPLVVGGDEQSYEQNRRCEFLISS